MFTHLNRLGRGVLSPGLRLVLQISCEAPSSHWPQDAYLLGWARHPGLFLVWHEQNMVTGLRNKQTKKQTKPNRNNLALVTH